jgi:phosphoribosyl-ATP pyrophosphohydrolase/phosphoribosyl-AMP cyclohydrolase/histidinol dehydrogenase
MASSERFLVSVELEKLDSDQEGGLDFKTISYLDRVYTTVTTETFDAGLSFLHEHFTDCVIYINVTKLEDLQQIITLLDNGATKVLVSYHQLKSLVENRLLSDLSRLIFALDHSACEGNPKEKATEIKNELREVVGLAHVGVYLHDVYDWALLKVMEEYAEHGGFPTRYISISHNTREYYKRALKGNHIPIVPSNALTLDPDKHANLMSPELLIVPNLITDRPDKLYPTVVCTERGVCLGLVYSNSESIHASLSSGRGVYKSRSRPDELWIKGKTSGDIQELISIKWDCDGDCLQFTVRQRGDGKKNDLPMILDIDLHFRLLSLEDSNLFWRTVRPFETRTNNQSSQIFCCIGLIHSEIIQRTRITPGKDLGRGDGALRC